MGEQIITTNDMVMRRHRRRALLRGLLGAGVAGLGGLLAPGVEANELKLGQMAPPLVLHALDGRKIATRDLLGKVVIVTFWASYCDPCREELPLLSAYAEANAARGLMVLGFSLDGPELIDDVRKVAAHLSFPVGLLGNPWAGGYGRIWRIPVSFVIGRDGKLIYDGWQDKQPSLTSESLQRIVEPLLA
jgi:cytochrome c biogenesis protein CcmG/thiol:disulfide interchange protein DsbE